MKHSFDSTDFRRIMGCFTTGVAVVTMQDAEWGEVGLTINSLTSVSLDPALMLFCIDKKAHLYENLSRANLFAFNILSAEQENVSRHFANMNNNPAPDNLWDKPQDECPILSGTLGWILCRPHATHQGGDHTIVVSEVISLHKHESVSNPLLYFHGRYRVIA